MPCKRHLSVALNLVLVCLLTPMLAGAAENPQPLASSDQLCPPAATVLPKPDSFSADDKTHLQADKVVVDENQATLFQGNVVIMQKQKRIETDKAEYQKQQETIHATGGVKFLTPSLLLESDSADVNLKTDQATLTDSHYRSLQGRARGKAEEIKLDENNKLVLKQATYTTCDAQQTDWLLSASDITLDNQSHQGSAKHVVLRFKDVPFFYLPYLRFPLGDERMSGILFPTIGNSDKHGTELQVPVYWNIDPQYDATFTPWFMSKRGTMLQTEFRYLGESQAGQLDIDYLGNDKLFGDSREAVRWRHQATPDLGWHASADVNYVADANHLADFTTNINNSSTTHLLRQGVLSYTADNWLLNIKGEGYQALNAAEVYKRLPQVTLSSRFKQHDNQLNYELNAEYVRFDHRNYVVIGDRLDVKPAIYWPWRGAAGFFIPKLSVEYTAYNLQQTTASTELSRSVPAFSLDSGLFFERDTSLFGSNFVNTLEPQLFYVYVPYREQSTFPVFDTSAYPFNFNQPFSDYRFSGIDRVGDDNRLTAALTTRFINQHNGQEMFMARLGRVYYFADRKVQLPSVPVATAQKSNLIGELGARLGDNWSLNSQVEWDPRQQETAISSNRLSYQAAEALKFGLAYRYQRNLLDTREVDFDWQISPRWRLLARQLFDLRNDHNLETVAGLDYDSCCWGLRLTYEERFDTTSLLNDRGVYLQLVLKGLGGIGRSR